MKVARKQKKKRRIVEVCPVYPGWSVARYQSFVRSSMRMAWRKWPPRYEALKNARRKSTTSNKKQKWEFQCAACQNWFMGKEVYVDHIEPWGQIWKLSFEEAWSRLLVSSSRLQVLCKQCHDLKSKTESN